MFSQSTTAARKCRVKNFFIYRSDDTLIRPDELLYRPDNIIIRPDELYIIRTNYISSGRYKKKSSHDTDGPL